MRSQIPSYLAAIWAASRALATGSVIAVVALVLSLFGVFEALRPWAAPILALLVLGATYSVWKTDQKTMSVLRARALGDGPNVTLEYEVTRSGLDRREELRLVNTSDRVAYDLRVLPVKAKGGSVAFSRVESLPPRASSVVRVVDLQLSPTLQQLGLTRLYEVILDGREPAGPLDALASFLRPRSFTLRAEYANTHGNLFSSTRTFRLLPAAMRVEANAPLVELIVARTEGYQ